MPRYSLIFVAFVVTPLVELMLLVRLGELIGFWPTVGLVLLTGLIGAAMLLTPGVLTDVIGFCGLIPLTRSVFRRKLSAALRQRTTRGMWSSESRGVDKSQEPDESTGGWQGEGSRRPRHSSGLAGGR